MKKKMLAASAALLITVMIIALAGCGNASSGTAGSTQTGTAQTSDPAPSGNTSDTQTVVAEGSDLFTTRDLTQNPDLSGAQYITVTDGQTVNITEEGIYVLSGSARDAVIAVDAGDDDKVQLVLDGLYIENAHQCCILVENADKVFITSVEDSVNTLAVSGKFTSDEDAVIFSRDDLVLNGLGTVEISSTGDGIKSNDELKITGGTWNVTASDGAIKAHEGIYACAGTCSLTAGGDGLHAENNDDDSVGSVVIEGGIFAVRAGDDGIHATTRAVIEGGSIAISAAEGIEATQVIIN
ncbi:MAG: carbohydrate-binding domain-containing protein, partial [Eubacteriaceae bacterium]|nr:carbohydrate-binding domain-containing protein [Eubacteriaceae bacterium]